MPRINKEIGASRKLGGLLKTGQTTQYGSYEDDGYFQKGSSKQYTILTTGQYAGTTSITLYAKTDVHSNNCVYDRRTKLMWSRYVSATLGPNNTGTIPWTTNANGEGIFPYVAAANAALLAGYSDWRIPNIKELESIQNEDAVGSVPDTTAFPAFATPDVWTSTTNKEINVRAMLLSFGYGGVERQLKTSNYNTLMVRGG